MRAGLVLLMVAALFGGRSHGATLRTDALTFEIGADGAYAIHDKVGGVTWRSHPGRFGQVVVNPNGKRQTLPLDRCEAAVADGAVVATFRPLAGDPSATLRVTVAPTTSAGAGLTFSYVASENLPLESVRLLDDALSIGAAEKGYLLVPCREGLLIPADSGVAFARRFDTSDYEGLHMNMLGLVKSGATAVLTWEDPYVAAELRSVTPAEGQSLTTSLVLRKSARSFSLRFAGKGDLVTVAEAYRRVAEGRGLVVTMDQKIKGDPARAKLLGASNFKLWSALNRRMDEASRVEEKVSVNWTFDEAAEVARHLKDDLKMERVLFTVGGWIHRGYDNQHPDVLPAAPELGGDAGLARAAKAILSQGYLFCLHDNYQDMYRDAPSWDERYLMRRPDGSLAKGGKWAGGLAYLTCSPLAVELAKRPQNLPAVKALTGANSYFIDTTYAAGLQECFSKEHPLTRADDLRAKQQLSDYARGVFGVFGSECGREWAIPHADFFEGLTGVSGGDYHNLKPAELGATVVPLFELVYRDTIAAYGKYGYAPRGAGAYVLHHVSIGRPLNYHNVPPHLYWKSADAAPLKLVPSVARFEQTGPRRFAAEYAWEVGAAPAGAGDWRVFVHFVDASGKIRFQGDHAPAPAVDRWPAGTVKQGPIAVNVPAGVEGTFEWRVGLVRGERRANLDAPHDGESRVLVGRVTVAGDEVAFTPPAAERAAPAGGDPRAVYTRGDGGWADGLHPFDRFLKNTHEILSPLNELTGRERMTDLEFLAADRSVRRTTFGRGERATRVTVNFGPGPYRYASPQGGEVELPAMGFAVESPEFVAFCASAWGGVRYGAPALFTLRSLDGLAVAESKRVRVFHGFGDARVGVGGKELRVEKEGVVAVR